MHASSLENMYRCYDRHIRNGLAGRLDQVMVLDVGGSDVNGSYREVFSGAAFRYVTADIAPHPGVDVVLDDPYRLPLEDSSVDVVISGQMLEHCEYFWMMFAEMVRVLKDDGYLFLIAPSGGPIHRYPVDCYRFYPDSYHALARLTGCHVIDLWLDERGPWRDLVGVFAKQVPPIAELRAISQGLRAGGIDPALIPPGSAEEEATRGELHYLAALAKIHETLEPSLYLEIGVRFGRSLRLARCPAIGVDPDPALEDEAGASTTLFAMTSDAYFAGLVGHSVAHAPDFVFIDGMHQFEYALRDFMNVERLAHPGTLIAIDDIFPCHPVQAERVRRTRVWTGDVWRLHRALAERRPDLILLALDTEPTGLLLVAGLDPANRILWDDYNPLVRHYRELESPAADVFSRRGAISPLHPIVAGALNTLRRLRHSTRDEVYTGLRAMLPSEENAT